MKKTIRYFVDMDGTIARFYEDEACLEKMFERGYFENLRSYEKLVADIRKLIKCGKNVYILSACVNTPYCKEEKIKWLTKYLPEIPAENILLIDANENKTEIVKKKGFENDINVLLDDYGKNLREWEDGLPFGLAIKVINEINNRKNKNYVRTIINY